MGPGEAQGDPAFRGILHFIGPPKKLLAQYHNTFILDPPCYIVYPPQGTRGPPFLPLEFTSNVAEARARWRST